MIYVELILISIAFEPMNKREIPVAVKADLLPYAKTYLKGETKEQSTITFFNDTENNQEKLTIKQEFSVRNQGKWCKINTFHIIYRRIIMCVASVNRHTWHHSKGPGSVYVTEFTVSVPLIAPNGEHIFINEAEKFAPKLSPRSQTDEDCELTNMDSIRQKLKRLTTHARDTEVEALMDESKFSCKNQNSICAIYRCSAGNSMSRKFKVRYKSLQIKNKDFSQAMFSQLH